MTRVRDLTRQRLGGVAVCAAIALLGSLALFVPPEEAANLRIVPDEGQYAIAAYNLFARGTYAVTFNHHDYPPLYPYGFPVLLLPAFYLLGGFVGNLTYVVFLVNLAILFLTYAVAVRLGGRLVGCVATLLLLGNRTFLSTGHHILSHNAAALLFLACVLLVLRLDAARGLGARTVALWVTLGLLLGYMPSIHLSSVFLFPAIALVIFLSYRGDRRLLLGSLVTVGAVAGCLLVPFLLYNEHLWGNYLGSAYEYWFDVPRERFFGLGYGFSIDGGLLWEALRGSSVSRLRRFAESGNAIFYAMALGGAYDLLSPKLYSPAVTLLAAIGARQLWKGRGGPRGREFVLVTGLALAGLLVLFVPYYFRALRYLMPILPLVLTLAAVGGVWMLREWRQGGWWAGRTLTAALLALVVVADVGRAFVRQGLARPQSHNYEVVRGYEAVAEKGAVIASTLDPNYVSHFVVRGTDRRYIPLVRNIHYIARDPEKINYHWVQVGMPVVTERPEVVAELLRRGVPVYSDDLAENRCPREYQALRSLFEWKVAAQLAHSRIYRLGLPPGTEWVSMREQVAMPVGGSGCFPQGG